MNAHRRPGTTLLYVCGALLLAGCASVPARRPAPMFAAAAGTAVMAEPAPKIRIDDEAADLGPLLEATIARAGIPGAAALVLRGDHVIARGVAGVRKAGSAVPIVAGDKFELCSAAKAMTATVAARVIEAGRLQWTTTFAEIFSDELPHIDPAWRAVTLEEALAHRAGLEDEMFSFVRLVFRSRATPHDQRRQLAARILSRPPPRAPRAESHYTSADYLLVAAALEKVTGRTWEELMGEHVFAPLGLLSAGFGPPGTAGKVDQPWGHGARWLLYIPLPGSGTAWDPGHPHADYPAVAAPAGLVHMSMPDWGGFVAAHLRSHPANPQRKIAALLGGDSFARLHEGGGATYSGGWFTGTRAWAKGSRPGDTGRVLFHQGDNGRWNTVVYMAPEIDFAVLVACNRGRMWKPVDAIASALVSRFARAEMPAREIPAD